jgi:hypothetical protein
MEEEYKGYTIKIILDDNSENPREAFDHTGKMFCMHRRYSLGDKEVNQEYSIDEIETLKEEGKIIILPLFLYDHSGITINTTGFSCQWDSGQIGFIFAFKEDIKKEYSWKILTKKRIETIEGYLRNEVKEYDHYLTGNVYGYIIEDKEGEIIDSCSGYYGNPEGVLEDAKFQVDYFYREEMKKPKQKLFPFAIIGV